MITEKTNEKLTMHIQKRLHTPEEVIQILTEQGKWLCKEMTRIESRKRYWRRNSFFLMGCLVVHVVLHVLEVM